MEHRCILIFVKFPTPGRVKTRLAAGVGDAKAAEIYRKLVSRVLATVAKSPADELRVMFDPPGEEDEHRVREWLAADLADIPIAVNFVAQCGGDLGDRLEAAFAGAFADGADAVAAIGTDCVGITTGTFERAWSGLAESDAVFGPTEDGGYYLLSTRELQPCLFRGIPWSAEDTLARSLQAGEKAGLSIGQLEVLSDVDDIDDWEKADAEFFS